MMMEIRSAESPHDDDGTRVPAITVTRRVVNINQPLSKNNNNTKNVNNKPAYNRNPNKKNIPNRTSSGNNNNHYNNKKKTVRYNEPEKRNRGPPPPSRGRVGQRKMSLPEASLIHFNSMKISGPKAGTSLIKEIVTVDHVSPGLHGEELYLYIQGNLSSVNKPENQPLVIEPSNVTFNSKKEKEKPQDQDEDEDSEEEKELWEKLCDESRVKITFDPSTWEVVEIIGLSSDDEDLEEDDKEEEEEEEEEEDDDDLEVVGGNKKVEAVKKVGKPKSPLLWARGKSPPRRAGRVRVPVPAKSSAIPIPKSNAKNNVRGGRISPEKTKSNKNNKNGESKGGRESARRGSLPSVRVLMSPSMTGEKRAKNTDGDENGINDEDVVEKKEEDMKERMDRLEQMNMLLMRELEEARNKIKMLEQRPYVGPLPASVEQNSVPIPSDQKDVHV